VHSG
jgi:hypothetical protein